MFLSGQQRRTRAEEDLLLSSLVDERRTFEQRTAEVEARAANAEARVVSAEARAVKAEALREEAEGRAGQSETRFRQMEELARQSEVRRARAVEAQAAAEATAHAATEQAEAAEMAEAAARAAREEAERETLAFVRGSRGAQWVAATAARSGIEALRTALAALQSAHDGAHEDVVDADDAQDDAYAHDDAGAAVEEAGVNALSRALLQAACAEMEAEVAAAALARQALLDDLQAARAEREGERAVLSATVARLTAELADALTTARREKADAEMALNTAHTQLAAAQAVLAARDDEVRELRSRSEVALAASAVKVASAVAETARERARVRSLTARLERASTSSERSRRRLCEVQCTLRAALETALRHGQVPLDTAPRHGQVPLETALGAAGGAEEGGASPPTVASLNGTRLPRSAVSSTSPPTESPSGTKAVRSPTTDPGSRVVVGGGADPLPEPLRAAELELAFTPEHSQPLRAAELAAVAAPAAVTADELASCRAPASSSLEAPHSPFHSLSVRLVPTDGSDAHTNLPDGDTWAHELFESRGLHPTHLIKYNKVSKPDCA